MSKCGLKEDDVGLSDAQRGSESQGGHFKYAGQDPQKYFEMYKEMGGKKSLEDYKSTLDTFYRYNTDILLNSGGPVTVTRKDGKEHQLSSRADGYDAFVEDACGGDSDEANKIFYSVDAATSLRSS